MNIKTLHFPNPEPKVPHYQPNGCGRDTYILFNNGGLSQKEYLQQINEQSTQMRSSSPQYRKQNLEITPKVIHYHSDGSGRDNYIMQKLQQKSELQSIYQTSIDEGGLTSNIGQQKVNFFKTLRQYTDTQRSLSPSNRNLKTKLPPIELQKYKKIESNQKFLVSRLAQPKLQINCQRSNSPQQQEIKQASGSPSNNVFIIKKNSTQQQLQRANISQPQSGDAPFNISEKNENQNQN